jgi:peptidoglycan/LPS O-acetylase OafA/YrhL
MDRGMLLPLSVINCAALCNGKKFYYFTHVSTFLFVNKQHYEILDGLRGIAAVIVVIFHFTEIVIPSYPDNLFGHGYLAVDFFFCLSGFVIGYAYDDRVGKISVGEFFKKRLIRLHPLVVFGAVLGLIATVIDPFGNDLQTVTTGRVALTFLCAILLIPFPDGIPNRYGNLMPLNAPAWSLFAEYVANVVYILFLGRLNRKWLIPLAVIAAGLLIYVSHKAGNLMGGWSGDTFFQGYARLFFEFTAGLIIHRYQLIIKNKLGFVTLAILLIATLIMPYASWNWLQEPLTVILIFPLILSLGAGSTVSSRMRKICKFSGDISYPLYMTHYMVMWVFAHYTAAHPMHGTQLALFIACATLVLIGFAYLVLKFYDEPVRKRMR